MKGQLPTDTVNLTDMKNDILNSLNRLIRHTFVRHRGILLERSTGGFKYGNTQFSNLEELDAYIDKRFERWKQSFNRIKSIQNVKIENNSEAR